MLVFAFLLCSALGFELLDGVPVGFAITGEVSYTSDAGYPLTGYNISVSYSKYSWLGIMFMLDGQNNDVLVVSRDSTYTGSGFKTSVSDYYVPQGNSDRLNSDTQTGGDVTCVSYPNSNSFSLVFTRSEQNSQGEDWVATANRYGMLKVCFFTGAGTFSQSNWKGDFQSCYSYEINNIVSTYRGQEIFSFDLNGVPTKAYGYIDGPVINANLFLYHAAPSGTYSQPVCVVFDLGFIQENVGNDYIVSSTVSSETGDYFGFGLTSMTKDINYHGFEDSAVTVTYINAGSTNTVAGLGDIVKIAMSRPVLTGDVYDNNITTVQQICVKLFTAGTLSSSGTNIACTNTTIPVIYPIMTVRSAIQIWDFRPFMGIMAGVLALLAS